MNESDVTLRVTAPTSIRFGPGVGVRLAVAQEACVPLIEPEEGRP